MMFGKRMKHIFYEFVVKLQSKLVRLTRIFFSLCVCVGAINQLARNLACEWARDDIRANAVAPNFIQTAMAQPVMSDKLYGYFFLFSHQIISCTSHSLIFFFSFLKKKPAPRKCQVQEEFV